MELAGLEPATSWVRSSGALRRELADLQHFQAESLERRNISRNNSAVVLHSDNEYPVPSLRANTTAGAPAYSCGRSAWLFSNAWVTAAS
jgi:hypothetical protein